MAIRLLAFGAFVSSVFGGKPSRDLIGVQISTKIGFYDFDQTNTVTKWGMQMRDLCNQSLIATRECDQIGDLTNALNGLSDPTAEAITAFGGQDRIDRLSTHYDRVKNDGNTQFDDIFILSTSWWPVPKEEWKNFINATLQLVGLHTYFPYDNILTVDDPGVGQAANKGAVALAKRKELLGDTSKQEECIFIDDSSGNIASVGTNEAACDTLYLSERLGMDETDLNYAEARAILLPCPQYVSPTRVTSSPTVSPSEVLSPTEAETTEGTSVESGESSAARAASSALLSICIFVLYS